MFTGEGDRECQDRQSVMGGVRKIGQEDGHVPWQCKSQWSGTGSLKNCQEDVVGLKWLIKSAFSASKGDNKPIQGLGRAA